MNKFEKLSRDTYNEKAKDYDSSMEGKFTVKFQKLILDNIKVDDGDEVLDIACGNGRLLKHLSQKANIKGYGIDIADLMVEEAKRLLPSMDFYTAKCDDTPFNNGQFDALTVCAAFHHFPDIDGFADEAERILKVDGKLYIAEIYYPAFARFIFNPFVKFSKAGDVKFYAPKEIVTLFERKSFVVEDVILKEKMQLIILRKTS